MDKKSRSFQKRIGNGYYMNGPLTSGGLTYKEMTSDTDNRTQNTGYNQDNDINLANMDQNLY